MQTLRDRVLNKIIPGTSRSGRAPLFTNDEESAFVDHLKFMATLGYGYTASEVMMMASDYAVYLGKRTQDHPVTEKWYRKLKSRWPALNMISPRALSKERAQCTSEQVVKNYFTNLNAVLTTHNLHNQPNLIYNFDEKGLQTEHSPPKILSAGNSAPAITSARSSLTTLLGCGNALGTQIPPYFIFKGARMQSELLDGSTAGAAGTVSETGWSNSDAFLNYLKNHFLKYVQRPTADQPVLLILDGHLSHINLPVLDWAKENNIIMFVLPAHTSHILQPLDVGCYGPLQRIYNSECHKFLRATPSSRITRYNVCALACKAYMHALSVNNLRSSFQRTGIYPFDSEKISKEQLFPSQAYQSQPESQLSNSSQCDKNPKAFFEPKNKLIEQKQEYEKNNKSNRKTLSKLVSGRCITDAEVESEIREYCQQRSTKTSENTCNKRVRNNKQTVNTNKKTPPASTEPQPGPSGITTQACDSTAMAQDDSVKCCVCNREEPEELENCDYEYFVKWAGCDVENCNHWTHLGFCCKQRVVRLRAKFECPCHQLTEE